MRKVILLCATLVIAGCAARSVPVSDGGAYAGGDAAAGDFMAEKLRQNGAAIFCEQDAYSICLGITQEACFEELSPTAVSCFERAERRYGRMVGSNFREFGAGYFGCMIVEHVYMHNEDHKEVGSCIESIGFDKYRMLKSMFK